MIATWIMLFAAMISISFDQLDCSLTFLSKPHEASEGPQKNPGPQATDQFQFKDEEGGEGITKDGKTFSFHSYSSGDGVKLLTYIEDFASVKLAKGALDEKARQASSVSARGPKLDKNGKPVGERVVLTEEKTQNQAESQSFICWTTGSTLHWIQSKSLKHALAFEKTLDP